MRLLFSRNQRVSIREQLTTQLLLAIATGELAPGTRLPSTRALARQFHLHANTVSAAYQDLEQQGWVASVRGSGVYVRELPDGPGAARSDRLECLISEFLRMVRRSGFSADEVRDRLHARLATTSRCFAFVHPDHDLRRLIVGELCTQLAFPVTACDIDPVELSRLPAATIFVTMPGSYADVRALLPGGTELTRLRIRSVSSALARYGFRPNVLLVVISIWPGFLEMARKVMIAAGYAAEQMVFRDARHEGWQRGLNAGIVICDVPTAALIPRETTKILFPLIASESIEELREHERFVGAPL